MVVAFEAHRFRSTAQYYLRYRMPYPDRLIKRVASETLLSRGDQLLDLGCGPGQLALAFARIAGARVTGIDPEPEMLDAARDAARAQGLSAEFKQGSSYDLDKGLAPLALTVMGRSFHWMDRPATLRSLDAITGPGGCVALFGDRTIAAGEGWRDLFTALSERFSPERAATSKMRRSAEWVSHEDILLGSPFSDLLRIGIVEKRVLSADDIVGRAFSMSVTSPQALGSAVSDFEAALRQGLAELSPKGEFSETVEISALIARRP